MNLNYYEFLRYMKFKKEVPHAEELIKWGESYSIDSPPTLHEFNVQVESHSNVSYALTHGPVSKTKRSKSNSGSKNSKPKALRANGGLMQTIKNVLTD